MASILTSAFMFFKTQDKAHHCKALILVSLCVLVAWKHNGTKACVDSSFLILDGSHFHCCLPRSPVASPKAAIILIHKYITWIYVLVHTHTNTHTQSLKYTNSYTYTARHLYTLRCILAVLNCNVLQYESREHTSPHLVPEGTIEEEFCFSFESL